MTAEGTFEAHPHLLRRQAMIWTVVMFGAALFGWFSLPAAIRAMFTLPQTLTLLFFLAFMLGIVWVVASGYVRADAQGLSGRNGLRRFHYRWDEVESIRYREGDHALPAGGLGPLSGQVVDHLLGRGAVDAQFGGQRGRVHDQDRDDDRDQPDPPADEQERLMEGGAPQSMQEPRHDLAFCSA